MSSNDRVQYYTAELLTIAATGASAANGTWMDQKPNEISRVYRLANGVSACQIIGSTTGSTIAGATLFALIGSGYVLDTSHQNYSAARHYFVSSGATAQVFVLRGYR